MKKTPPSRPTDPSTTWSQPTRELWATLLASYDIADAHGLTVLRTACAAHDMMLAAQKLVDDRGVVVLDKFGQLKSNPATVVLRDSRAAYLRALQMLGLDLEPLNPGAGRPAGAKTRANKT